MNTDLLKILLHLSSVISTVKDLEKAIQDLIQKKPSGADWEAFLSDLASDVDAGLIPLPQGLTSDAIKAAIAAIKAA